MPAEAAAPAEAISEKAPAVDEEEPEAPVEGALLAEEPTAAEAPAETALLAPEQLDILVAPVALYPDPLLSQVLMASTYPLEIVYATRWLKANPKVKGEAAIKAAEGTSIMVPLLYSTISASG